MIWLVALTDPVQKAQFFKDTENFAHKFFIIEFVIVDELEFKEAFHESHIFKYLSRTEPESLLSEDRGGNEGRRKQEVNDVVFVVFQGKPLAVLKGEDLFFQIVISVLELADNLAALHTAQAILKA